MPAPERKTLAVNPPHTPAMAKGSVVGENVMMGARSIVDRSAAHVSPDSVAWMDEPSAGTNVFYAAEIAASAAGAPKRGVAQSTPHFSEHTKELPPTTFSKSTAASRRSAGGKWREATAPAEP